jgi:Mg-chelatase subunit ChlD
VTARALLVAAGLLGACAPAGRARTPPVAVATPLPITASLQLRVDAWTRLATATSGTTVESEKPEDVPGLIRRIFDQGLPSGPVDVVFCVDTTGSMGDDIEAVKRDMREILAHLRERNPDFRIGVVAYRDIHDEYLTRTLAFLTDDEVMIEAAIAAIEVTGGDDWREHVYAGIHTALGQPWRRQASQHIVLMGDAPPHDDYDNDPRTLESVTARAQTAPLRVRIHTIGIKCDATCEATIRQEDAARAAQGRVIP